MESHVRTVSKTCQYHLRNISRIRYVLSEDACRTIIQALITSRLDYALLYGHLQPVGLQNMAARIITRTSKRDHIKPVLKQLHWMPFKQRIKYKLLIHTFKVLSGQSPNYLIELVQPYHPTLPSQDKALLIVPKSKTRSFGDRHFSVSSAKHQFRNNNHLHSK